MIPPGAESDPELMARAIRNSPGMLVAEEVDRWARGETPPLADQDVADASATLGEAVKAATPIPGFAAKWLLKHILPRVHAAPINIATIIVGAGLPVLVYLNANALADFLIRHGLFEFIDLIRGWAE